MQAQARHVGYKATGRTVTVPSNNFARLMYYLNCVASITDLDKIIPSSLRDYNEYSSLTYSEKKQLVKLCFILTPKFFVQNKVFINDDELHILPENTSNQFYEVNDTRIGVHINSGLTIAGRRVTVSKYMVFERNWIKNNWENPISAVADILDSSELAALL